jgi:hypothetical protein|tara:strand:- start:272 stop:1066 length:795 start_codon:yes stop_codon:yes gene_type:complete
MASIHKNNGGINLEGMMKYANPLSTGSYGNLQASNISENPTELTEQSVGQLNREYQDQWMEENVDEGMAPDLALSPLMSVKSLLGLVKKGKNLLTPSNIANVKNLGKNVGDFLPSGKTFKITSGGQTRQVTTAAVRNADGTVSHQPFYKSSGTSGPHGASRKDRWMPYVGQGGGGFFHKGRINLQGKVVSHNKPRANLTEAQEFAGRFGGDPNKVHSGTKRMVGMSDELKRVEGSFKQTGKGTLQGEVGNWIGKENLGDMFWGI